MAQFWSVGVKINVINSANNFLGRSSYKHAWQQWFILIKLMTADNDYITSLC